MKLTIDIQEDEIAEIAKQIIAERVAAEVIKSEYGCGRFYRDTIKNVVREVIRSDIDNLSERAVIAASKSIENRAVKKLIDKLENR